VAALAAGAGAWFASSAYDGAARMSHAADRPAIEAARSDAESAVLGANLSFGAAGVAAVTGGVLWWLGHRAAAAPDGPEAAAR